MSSEERRRRTVPPWASKAWKGGKAGAAKLKDQGLAFAKAIAGSPAALAALAAGLSAATFAAGAAYTEARTNPIESRVDTIEQTVSEAEAILGEMVGEVESLQGSTDELVAGVGELAEAIANGDEESAADIARRASQSAAVLRQQSARLDDLADELTALDDTTVGAGAVARVATDVRDLSDRLASTNDTLDALAGNVAGVQENLTEAEGTLASVSESVSALQGDLIATNEAVAALGSELDGVAAAAESAAAAASAAQGTADSALATAEAVEDSQPQRAVLGSSSLHTTDYVSPTGTFTIPDTGTWLYEFEFAPNFSTCGSVSLYINDAFYRTVPASGQAGTNRGWASQLPMDEGEHTWRYESTGMTGNCLIASPRIMWTRVG